MLRIDPLTLDVEQIDLLAGYIASIVVVDDVLWYAASGGLGRYDLSTGVHEPGVMQSLPGSILRASPGTPHLLYSASTGVSPANLWKIDISVDPPVAVAQTPHGPIGSNLGDFEISDDGSTIWSASGSPYSLLEIRTSDMALTGRTFDTGPYPKGVAQVTTDGTTHLVGGVSSADHDAQVFDASNPAITEGWSLTGRALAGSVAISVDGQTIYAVQEVSDPDMGELARIDRVSGDVSTVPIALDEYFQSGIVVDPVTERLFVALDDSVGVFGSDGSRLDTIPNVASPREIVSN